MAQLKGDSTLVISALSRPLDLGTLYNARNDQLIPGITLWKAEDMKSKTQVTPQPNTNFQVSTSESLSEKMNLLDVSTSVKASFLAGIVEVSASANYLNQKTSSTRQCRTTLKYHVTTEFKELMISELEAPNPDAFDMRDATHVVAGVLYGANALMEFQETARDDSQKQDVKVQMSVMLNKIPFIDVSAQGSVNMSDEDKKKVKNFSCRFYGDFGLKNLPSTFEEAVKAYKELPSLLGEKGEKAVPLTVWLYPLSKLGSFQDKLKRMISELFVSEAEKMIDDFHQAEIRTNDLLGKSKAIKAKDIVCKLEQFQSGLRIFTAEMLRKMADLVPAIREGKKEEAVFRELLKTRNDSAFSGSDMEKWLDDKETEVNTLTLHLKKLQYDIKPPGRELDMFLADPDVKDAFVFSFTSLSYEEPYLKRISQEADGFKDGALSSTPKQYLENPVPWYLNPHVKEAMYSSINIFNNAPTKHKVISYIADPNYPGAAVRWYRNAVLMKPQVKNIQQLYSCDLTFDQSTANTRVVLSNGNKIAACVDSDQPYPANPGRYILSASVSTVEPLTGRHYFEFEWDLKSVIVVIAIT
ncbi:cytolytic toxin-alpha-like [Engraulis encrasicolus]|uniref:cytolytic toxin-alpha-like n=1 Tax=Engraulis encrasicolus TaxID=184585 RepID=UPI002FD0B36E